MRNALPGQPGSASHLPDNHRLQSMLKGRMKFGFGRAGIQISKISQYKTIRLVITIIKNLNINQGIHSSKTNPRLIPLLLQRVENSNHSAIHFHYSRSTLTPELR